jgi:endonuclease YncB( thermonuclease family)
VRTQAAPQRSGPDEDLKPAVRATTEPEAELTAAPAPAAADTRSSDLPEEPAENAAALAVLAAARREVGHDAKTALTSVGDSQTTSAAAVAPVSPLGTPDQLRAEKLAQRIANSLPVKLMKLVLRSGFTWAAERQFAGVDGPDQENIGRLNAAVDAYAMASAFQQQLLNSNKPTVVMQVAPPHAWYGQNVGASRILYDNPDTIYRFMGVNGASSYVITGKFADLANLPADTTFSVLTGLTGNTAAVLTKDQLVIGDDGTFTITLDRTPANGRQNHLQLTADTTIVATRNTLSDWANQQPMSLEITRVGGPPNSLFSQLGGFAIPGIGPAVVRSKLLTALVSSVPPLPFVPTVLRGAVTAVIMALGVQREAQYMAVATTDPTTGERIEPNVLKNPARNAEFLATQLQSAGYFQLADEEALVITIDRAGAGYFIVPVTDDWTVTKDYWNEQTSLNNVQSVADDAAGTTYTIVVSPSDPGVANWVSTGGLNQGTISIRFQDIDPAVTQLPTVSARVVALSELASVLPPNTQYVTAAQRAAQIATRKAGFDNRFAPYPQQ